MAAGCCAARPCWGGALAGDAWGLDTSGGPVRAGVVVNCAGNHADLVEAIARPSPFHIRPRKGQFVVFDKCRPCAGARHHPAVPDERTKESWSPAPRVGNLLVGPTAEDQEDRSPRRWEKAWLQGLIDRGRQMLPGLADHPVTAAMPACARRPSSRTTRSRRWATATGSRERHPFHRADGSLGIAAHVTRLYGEHFGPLQPQNDPVWTPVPNLAEDRPRPTPCRAGPRSSAIANW